MYSHDYRRCTKLGFRQTLLVRYRATDVESANRLNALLASYPSAAVQPSSVLIADGELSRLVGDGVELIKPGQSKVLLGREYQRVLFDANQIRADDLAIGTGLIPAGGLCILLLDQARPLNAIAKRLLAELEQQATPTYIGIDLELEPAQVNSDTAEVLEQGLLQSLELDTHEQRHLVDELVRNARGRARRPLLVSADRGRGKTSALGLAAAELLPDLKAGQSIVLVAKQYSSVASAFRFAVESLERAGVDFEQGKHSLGLGGKSLCFVLASELYNGEIDGEDIVWVDEAASLPVALLKRVLMDFKRTVFISTIQGYEGTGKGFELKFKPFLARYSQQYKQINLTQPLRWQSGDPLELACQRALLLDASVELEAQLAQLAKAQHSESVRELRFEHLVVADWFAADAELSPQQQRQLKQLWGLLSLAHYQTSPMDLQLLLEDGSMRLLLAYQGDDLVGVVLFKQEGQIESQLAEQIALGKRRPKGHLLPQVFASQIGLTDALSLKAWRIIRIATRMDKVRQGIASSLLSELQNKAFEQQVDYLGSSFAATAEVINFWRKNDYLPIHLGRQKDPASGCYALAVSLPLGSLAAELSEQAYRHLHRTWPLLLNEYWRDLDNASLLALAVQDQFKNTELDELCKKQVELFSQNKLSFEAAFGALVKMLVNSMAGARLNKLTAQEQGILLDKILRNHSWSQVSKAYQVQGKKLIIESICSFCAF